jgi:anhydro-N-acetylmuramic acid kinase
MVYRVIGLMSGSSLDGLDIAHVQLEEVRGQWGFQILNADCLPYTNQWVEMLSKATACNVSDFLKLHTRYGKYLGDMVNEFISRHAIDHQVHFIATHGHTIFHEPAHRTTFQLGDGAALAAATGLPVISDLRSMDVALGGQGAPIVPIGDKLLFGEYDYLLNIGGIANITIQKTNSGQSVAFDICPANQVFNTLAEREGKEMDTDGDMASAGVFLPAVFDQLNSESYYLQAPPKSLSNEAARDIAFPNLLESSYSNYDLLHTFSLHIAHQVAEVIKRYQRGMGDAKLLVTGGGAFNTFLVGQLRIALANCGVEVVIPDANVIKFKEAVIMGLIGVLRWREEVNVLSSVTGSERDSIGGAIWMS